MFLFSIYKPMDKNTYNLISFWTDCTKKWNSKSK